MINTRCPEGLSSAERGKGAQTPPPRPAPHSLAQQQND
jgi:hypothetical protein